MESLGAVVLTTQILLHYQSDHLSLITNVRPGVAASSQKLFTQEKNILVHQGCTDHALIVIIDQYYLNHHYHHLRTVNMIQLCHHWEYRAAE